MVGRSPFAKHPVNRRTLLRTAAGLGLAASAGSALSGKAPARGAAAAPARAQSSDSLLVAARNTAPSLDHDFAISQEGHWARGLVEEKLLKYALKETEPGSGFFQEDFTKIEPYLAEDYSVSPDGRTITFKLHKDITTPAGNRFTADDILWNIQRSYALKGVNLTYYDKMLHLSGGANGVKKIDDQTFSITLDNPQPLIDRIWINNDIGWYDATAAKQHANDKDPWATAFLSSNSAGTGPYKVTQWAPGNQVVFEAFDGYYGQAPQLKTVTQREVPSSASRVALVQQGAVDIAERLTPRDRQALSAASGVALPGVKGSNLDIHIGLNVSKAPFTDKRVRQALNYAINQKEIIDSIFLGDAVPQVSLVPAVYPGHHGDNFPYHYDPERAKSLLSEAGLGDGFKSQLFFETDNTIAEQLAVLTKTRFKDIGVDIELVKIPPATFWDRIWKHEFSMIAAEFNAIVPDPGYCLALFARTGSFVNWMNYSNPQVDELIDKGFTFKDALDPARLDLLAQAQRIVVDDAVRVFGVEQAWILPQRTTVHGSQWLTAEIYRPQWMTKSGQ